MKILFNLILVFLALCLSLGLKGQGLELMKDQIGRPIQASKSTVDGYPYLFDDWKDAIVSLKSGKKIRVPKMNLNGLYNRLEYETSGRVFFIDSELFDRVLVLSQKDSIKFEKGFSQNGLNHNKFYEIIFNGELLWLKHHSKNIVNDQGASYASEARKIIKDEINFYVVIDNEAFPLKTNRAYLKRIFGKYKSLSKLIDDFSLDLKDDKSILNFIKEVEKAL